MRWMVVMPLWYGNLNVQTHLSVHRSSSSSNYEGNLITTMLIDSLILIRATTTTKSGINSFAVHSCSPKTVSSINGWLYLPPTMSIYRLLYIGTQFKKWSFVSVSESFHPKEAQKIRTVSFLLMRFRLFLSIWIRKWAKFFCGYCYRFDTIGHGWPGGLMA